MKPESIRWVTLCILVAAAGCRADAGGPQTTAEARRALAAALPASWSVVRSEDDQLPWGHYWGDWGANYTGPKGVLVVLVGPQPAYMCWQATSGEWHRDPVGREAIDVWLMPATYSQGFWSWLNPHAPPRAPLVFSGAAIKAYAQPADETDELASKAILAKATATGCGAEAATDLSWSAWRREIQRSLEETRVAP
jgi:hypothetical protein